MVTYLRPVARPGRIEAGMELHFPCLVKVGQGNNGYKTIELPEAAE